MKKKILIGLAAVFVVLQLFQIDKTNPPYDLKKDLLSTTNPPTEVAELLKNGCYDCHSNQSKFPWYTYIQPVGWFVQNHIIEARSEFNFSEWTTYSTSDQAEIFKECAEEVEEGKMPLKSYLPMHPEANFNPAQRQLLVDWFKQKTISGSGGEVENEEEGEF